MPFGEFVHLHMQYYSFANTILKCAAFQFFTPARKSTINFYSASRNPSITLQISSLPCFVSAENGITSVPFSTCNPCLMALTCFCTWLLLILSNLVAIIIGENPLCRTQSYICLSFADGSWRISISRKTAFNCEDLCR